MSTAQPPIVVNAFGSECQMFPSDVLTLGARVWSWRRFRWRWMTVATISIQHNGQLLIVPAPTALQREAVSTHSERTA